MDTDFSWYIEPPGDLLPRARNGYYKVSLDWRHVSSKTIARWRKFLPTRRIVQKELNKSVDDCTNMELAKFIVHRIKQANSEATTEKGVTKSVEGKKHGRREAKIEDLMADYQKFYDAKTPNDLDSLRQLCALKLAIEDLEKTERQMLDILKDPTKRGKITDSYVNSVVNARLKYLTEYRQLQTMLGIDRQSREKAESETGGNEYMRQLVVDTNKLLESKTVPIRCPVCPKTNATLLNMGFILSHFQGWTFAVKCPKCSSDILLSG